MNSDCNTASLAHAAFSRLECEGLLQTERYFDEFRIRYATTEFTDRPGNVTQVRLAWRSTLEELWIGYLHVASQFRGRGLGKRLVLASEQLAYRLNARSIQVYPLQSAREFWLDRGFAPHPRTARVVIKRVHIDRPP